ncbi:MAG: septal ring lytic transglycosylase RlpA family protein [Phaeodactylibacter sp.]|nr:septal ring lytic transglycosylase RlpA family protein [Phaeodactylibacter sp.]
MRFYMILGLVFLTSGLSAQQYSSRNTYSSNSSEIGTAVYYADYLHGRITAMGEVYRREAYTAAHKTFPKGTLLKVTRLDNGLSTVVRVNDRGPFVEGVMIDLSKAAAMDIGLLKDGRAEVRVDPVGNSDQNPRNGQLANQQSRGYNNTPAAYSSYSGSQRNPGYSSSSYQPQYPSAATHNSYSRNESFTAKGGNSNTSRYSAYNSAPPVGQAYANNNYYAPQQSANSYAPPPTSYNTTGRDLTAKGGYAATQQPQSYGQVGGSLASRAPAGATVATAAPAASTSSANTLPRGTSGYAVQVGSYRNTENAARQVKALEAQGLNNVFIMNTNGLQKVIIAPFPNKTDAQSYLDDLRRSFLIDGLVTMIR